MRKLISEVYFNRVIDDPSAPMGRKVLRDEYELKTRTILTTTDSRSDKELYKNGRRFSNFVCQLSDGKVLYDGKSYYGIHHYQLVFLTNDNLEPVYSY